MTLRELLEEGGVHDDSAELPDPFVGMTKLDIMDSLVQSAAEVMDRATHDRLMMALMRLHSSRF